MKLFLYLFTVLIALSSVSAYDVIMDDDDIDKDRYTDILKDIGYKKTRNIDDIHIGSDYHSDVAYAYYWFSWRGKRVTRSIIYLNHDLDIESDSFIKCVVLHELGHHHEARYYLHKNLSESYATQWAIENGCEDTKFYKNYAQELSN